MATPTGRPKGGGSPFRPSGGLVINAPRVSASEAGNVSVPGFSRYPFVERPPQMRWGPPLPAHAAYAYASGCVLRPCLDSLCSLKVIIAALLVALLAFVYVLGDLPHLQDVVLGHARNHPLIVRVP